jgi:hypothetical protein
MANKSHLIVANIPDDVRQGLARAARADCNAPSATARRILRDGLVARGFLKASNAEGDGK